MKRFRLIPVLTIEQQDRFWSNVILSLPTDCWWWVGDETSRGYGRFSAATGLQIESHRVAFFLTYAIQPETQIIRHRCDNKKCINPRHLILGSFQDNTNDFLEAGRRGELSHPQHGESNGRAKLTEDDVITIRSSVNSTVALAARFNVSVAMIRRIRTRRAWLHI